MTKRNLYNYLGELIGELELPDNTPESVWHEKIAHAAKVPAKPVIPDVTPRQVRQAIILKGVITIAQLESVLNSLPEPQKSLAIIEWEYSIVFKRYNPLVLAIGQILGWNSQQLDELWQFAASL